MDWFNQYLLFSIPLILLFLFVHGILKGIHNKELGSGPAASHMRKPFLAAAFGLFLLLFVGSFLSMKFQEEENKEILQHSESLAVTYAGVLSQYNFETLNEYTSSSNLFYLQMNSLLRNWMQQHSDIQLISFIKKNQDGDNYVVLGPERDMDGNGRFEGPRETVIPIGHPYRAYIQEMENAFIGKLGTQPVPTTDEWGNGLRTFAPVSLSGKEVTGVLAIVLNGYKMTSRIQLELWKGNSLLLIPFSVLLAFYWTYMRSRLEKILLSRKQMELLIQEERYRILSDSNVEGMVIHRDGMILEVNRALVAMFGYSQEELNGGSVYGLVQQEEIAKIEDMISQKRNDVYRVHGLHKSGRPIELELHVNMCVFNGESARAVAVRDITDQKVQEETIYRLAYYDELTGLPNKKRFLRSINRWLASASDSGRKAAVLFMDLDKFKPINDNFGHSVGDMVLNTVADRMRQALPSGGKLARWGGDEFIALIPNITERSEAEAAARRFIDSLANPMRCLGVQLNVGASIGVSLYPDNGTDDETLIRKADTAMYTGKRLGKARINFYDSNLQEKVEQRARLEQELRRALAEGQFELHYQPQVWMSTGEICGAEALIRWKHPDRGYISPAEFIPLAEETGLILELGDWVLQQACLDMKDLQDRGVAPLSIAVNLSALQFEKEDLSAKVKGILQATGLPPELLELEITETMMMDPKRALGILMQLKELGVRISIDDFGTGYSSLHYLNRFPIDKLKIDRSFVMDLDGGEAPITKAIISLARTMNLEIIAEGVEHAGQAEELMRLGCPLAQGYLYYKPIPVAALYEVVKAKV